MPVGVFSPGTTRISGSLSCRELIAVLSKVGGIDSGVGTGPEERPESLGMEREARATALVLILSIK